MTDERLAWSLDALRADEAWLRPMVRSLVADDSVASDVLQETWLRALQRPPRAPGTMRAWLGTVAKRLALTHRRAERRRRDRDAGLTPPAAVESTAATVERLALQRTVSLAVAELPEPFRTTVLLRHYHGLDTAAIAAHTGTSEANVRQRLHRGLAWLRTRLARDLGGDWRRTPAVLALLADWPATAAPPLAATTTTATTLLAMNKVRLATGALAVCLLAGAITLVPWSGSPPTQPPADAAKTVSAPPPDAPAPADSTPAHAPERNAVALTPPAPAAAPAAPLRGTVVDRSGRPVAAVEVGAVDVLTGAFTPFGHSDAAGTFDAPRAWPPAGIAATGPWVVLAWRPPAADEPGRAPQIVVGPGRRQVIRVLGPDGLPLGDTTAEVNTFGLVDFPLPLEDMQESGWSSRRAGQDGRHEWPQLPVGETFVAVGKPGHTPAIVPIDDSTPADVAVTLAPLRKGARIVRGVVTDARGAWVAGARVGLAHWRTTTGKHGEYSLTFEAGAELRPEMALYAVAAGWYPAIVPGLPDRLLAAEGGALTLDLQLLQPSLELRGRVVDHRGEPCPDVHVYPWELPQLTPNETAEDLAAPPGKALSLSGNPVRAHATTGADGAFAVAGLGARPYRLRVFDQKGGWAWTSGELLPGGGDVLVQLPRDPFGPIAGRVRARDGAPATGVKLRGMVEVFANGGGRVRQGLGLSVVVDDEGRFRIERGPRSGVALQCSGEGWISDLVDLDLAADPEALDVVLLRRCHVRIECTGAAWADAIATFLDAAGGPVYASERRRSTEITRESTDLHEGRTGVLAISESACTLVLRTRDGKREQRVPIVPRPGEVTTIVSEAQ